VLVVAAPGFAFEIAGSVDKIADGDTFWVCDANACHKIRLCGVKAPEQGESGYFESAYGLSKLVAGKKVTCIRVGGGTPCDGRSKAISFDRIVAQCFLDGGDVAITLFQQDLVCDWVKHSGGHYSKGDPTRVCH